MAKKYIIKKGKVYWPSKEMKEIAWVKDDKIYKQAAKDPKKFWEKLAKEGIQWEKKWDKVYEEKLPYFKWFKGGKLNLCYNALDRWVKEKPEKDALIWIPEPINERPIKITYRQLYDGVNRFANVLKQQGVKKGDVVAIYLPLIPEAVISMLACARLGAIHSVVFSAFSSDALRARIEDGQAKILITSDGYYRRGNKIELLGAARKAARKTTVKKIIVIKRLGNKVKRKFLEFGEAIKKAELYCKPEAVNSEDIMFILYTSGTTGKPKGIVHDTGGYAVQAYWTSKWNFNLREDDVMWCTADIGWITGHTYAVYGSLLNGATTLLYEGSPDYPDFSRWWKIIDDNHVTVFYTAPTAIRMFMKAGDQWLKGKHLGSLRILGTVGEPIDENAWNWYLNKIGGGRCPIIDTWWQTETGGTLINVLPGVGPFVPTVSGRSFPGTKHIIVDDTGKELKKGSGYLVQVSPFAPGMLHGVYKNHQKYVETYWRFKTLYDTSDGAHLQNGLFRLTGRTDDVMKVAGHRLATAELENAINESKFVNECAVVPVPHDIKGQVPVAFVVLKHGKGSEQIEKEIKAHVDKKIGPTARPEKIFFVDDLPKTRSGKIMRRIMKDILKHEEPQGLMTLLNPEAVQKIKEVVAAGSIPQQAKK
jgi:acetyl-CoA synthetase